jgi:predicted GNAT family acetyltransferase
VIKQISISDISQYFAEAKISGLTFCKSTNLYGLFIENKLVAFTGVIIMPKKAIFKNHFVPHENRGKGYFKILLNFSLDIVRHLNIKIVEATCTKMSIRAYLDRGFAIVKQYKNYTKVRHENIQ